MRDRHGFLTKPKPFKVNKELAKHTEGRIYKARPKLVVEVAKLILSSIELGIMRIAPFLHEVLKECEGPSGTTMTWKLNLFPGRT